MTILRVTSVAAVLLMLAACNQNEPTQTEELPTNAGATTPAGSAANTPSEPTDMLSDATTPMTGQTPNPVPEAAETNEPASEPAGGTLTTESQTSDALVERAGGR